jgi:hypothetical protein
VSENNPVTYSKKNKDVFDTNFAEQLYFSEDQIIIFPNDMGITGEVYRKKGMMVENNFGQLIQQDRNKFVDDDYEVQSDQSTNSVASPFKRRTSLR